MQDAQITLPMKRHERRNRQRGLPSGVIWDITYACPLRCVHCYTQSGRRPARQLSPAEILRIAEILIEMKVKAVFLSGGEPLIVKGLSAAVERWSSASIAVYLFTSGWGLDGSNVPVLAPLLAATHVSVDGATADVHDRVRQRAGSFERAMAALEALNTECLARRAARKPRLQFGVDCTLIQSNFHQLEAVVSEFPGRFSELSFVNVGAAVPSGMASTERFAETELLTEAQLAGLRRGVAGASIPGRPLLVSFSDQRHLQMHPDDVASGSANVDTMSIEPDGSVRAMSMYEGTVGNILVEPPELLWQRAQDRWHDPFVVQQLSGARTRIEWAAATRAIDQRYTSGDDAERVKKRLQVIV